MPVLEPRVLVDTGAVRVLDVACTAPRSGRGAEEHDEAANLVVPRRGAFEVAHGRRTLVADPGVALHFAAGATYRVAHPADGGDASTVVVPGPALAEEVARRVAVARVPLTGPAQLAVHALTAALRRPAPDALAAEEDALALLAALGPPAPVHTGPAQRRRVEEALALLAAAPGDRWRLADLAAAVHTSPFHLARQFRAVTGRTVGEHLVRLRAGLALERLAGGEDDLARLAADLGFASHSHLTTRLRRALGRTPSELRTILTALAPAPAEDPGA